MAKRRSISIYCDESCHLENDGHRAMVIGAVWCETERASEIARSIRGIKALHKKPADYEIKWTRVSPGLDRLYLELLDYFFSEPSIFFRAVVVPDKSALRHAEHRQTHDDFYYKMYYTMLRQILAPEASHRIFLDIKDTRGGAKVRKLQNVLENSSYDFGSTCVERTQQVRSEEVEQIQLADLLIGCVSAANRGTTRSPAKLKMIRRMQDETGYTLKQTTLLRAKKLNLLCWSSSESQ